MSETPTDFNLSTTSTARQSLQSARNSKNDEFFTQLSDIESELANYEKHFSGKVIYCNCDDPRVSNFFHYFSYGFERLGLKKLITTCYKNQNPDLFSENAAEKAIWLEYNGAKPGNTVPELDDTDIHDLEGDGDFRSRECVEFLKEADIVVTNPPFSLFREYIAQLFEYGKKFIIIGNKNAISYKEVFQLIKNNMMWVGDTPMGRDLLFDVPEAYAKELLKTRKEGSAYKIVEGVVKGRSQSIWFTNLDIEKRHEELRLFQLYYKDKNKFPRYDNYNAIEVDRVVNIPIDFDGAMGVPISFLDKYNPDQFQLLGIMNTGEKNEGIRYPGTPHGRPVINGVEKYLRVLIRKR